MPFFTVTELLEQRKHEYAVKRDKYEEKVRILTDQTREHHKEMCDTKNQNTELTSEVEYLAKKVKLLEEELQAMKCQIKSKEKDYMDKLRINASEYETEVANLRGKFEEQSQMLKDYQHKVPRDNLV